MRNSSSASSALATRRGTNRPEVVHVTATRLAPEPDASREPRGAMRHPLVILAFLALAFGVSLIVLRVSMAMLNSFRCESRSATGQPVVGMLVLGVIGFVLYRVITRRRAKGPPRNNNAFEQ